MDQLALGLPTGISLGPVYRGGIHTPGMEFREKGVGVGSGQKTGGTQTQSAGVLASLLTKMADRSLGKMHSG